MKTIRIGPYIIPTDRLYTESDEWIQTNENIATIGITDYAQRKLRDIVGVELPEKNTKVKRGEAVAAIESIKAAAEVYTPVSGEIVDTNERLYDEPELLNKDPYGEGWMFKIRIANPEELNKLLTPEKYAEKIKTEEQI